MKNVVRILSAFMVVITLLSVTAIGSVVGSNNLDTGSFSTKARAASFLSAGEADRYLSLFYDSGSSAYDLAYSALTGESEGTPEVWAGIAEGFSLFVGVSGNVNWNDALYDASDITVSNVTHIVGAISGMFSVIDSVDNFTKSENVARKSLEGLKTIKGLFSVCGYASAFPSELSLIMTSIDLTLDVAGYLSEKNFQDAVSLYEASIQIEYYTGQKLTYKTVDQKPNPFVSIEEAQRAYDLVYYKYYSKQMGDRVSGGSVGGSGGSGGGSGDDSIPVTSVSFKHSRRTLFANSSFTNTATVFPHNATNRTVTYSSSNTSIATVSSNGVVTAKSYGTVTIKATASNGVYSTCKVTVLPYNAIMSDGEYVITQFISNKISADIPSAVHDVPVTSIAEEAFKDTSVTSVTIPDSITSIGDYAFYDCDSLTNVTIPDSITRIGDYTFYSCRSLTSVTIPDSVTSIGAYAFYYCDNLTSVTIPESVTEIGGSAFKNCDSLTSVTIGIGVTHIGDFAFRECTSLTSVTIPGSVTSISDQSFYGCTGLTSVIIEDGVKRIGEFVFYECNSLTSVTIPDSVTSIGRGAFYDCNSLTNITIPGSVTSIDIQAFYGCTSLENVYYTGDIAGWCAMSFGSNGYSTPMHYADNLYINGELLQGDIVIPDSVTSIGDLVFDYCTSLTKVTIPDSVTSIGLCAFSGCTGLTSVTIGAGIADIGDGSFNGCTGIKDVYYPGSREQWDKISIGNNNSALTNATIHFVISGECGNSATWIFDFETGELIISGKGEMTDYSSSSPAPWDALRSQIKSIIIEPGVTIIGNDTFFGCENLEEVILPEGLTKIGNTAFRDCNGLKDVYYLGSREEWNEILIGSNNSALTNATIHFVISGECGNSATWMFDFETGELIISGKGKMTDYSSSSPAPWDEYRSSIKKITVESGVTTIGNDTFFGCENLEEVILPEGLTKIGNTAFRDCTALKNITIPDSVTSFGYYAFYGCTGFEEFVVGNGVKTIGNHAFRRCTNLRRITFPVSLTTVNKNAFNECSSLAFVVYMGTKDQWDSVTIGDSNEPLLNATMYFYDPEHSCEFGEWVVTVVPTTTNSGTKTHTCSICGAAEIAELPSLSIETAEQVTISFNTGIISGFDSGLSSLDSYITIGSDAYTWHYETNNGKLGTGSKVILKDVDTAVVEYTILIYGDTTGDGWYDGQDAIIVDCLANGMLTKEDVGEAVYTAADCNHDGVIDQLDVALLNEAGALLANVDQTKPAEVLLETSAEYVEYLDLIDQSPEIEAEDDTDTPKVDVETEETPVADTEDSTQQDAKVDIFKMILNFIRSIFEMLLSYIPVPLR
ncbi:MAG: leucine-rich repeat protein [Clostridia bacterium]|nr:leucine-rich repeat protein [Clostridia bacterium]